MKITHHSENLILKNCEVFRKFISENNMVKIDNVKDITVVIPMFNLIKYSDNYFLKIWKFIVIRQI